MVKAGSGEGSQKKVRVGVIGAGFSATTLHMPQFKKRSDVELVAVCRPGAKLLRTIQDKFEIPQGFENYREMLDRVPMDAVLVASPPGLHREHAVAALEKGLHVMCEKPMCTNAADAKALVAAAERSGKVMLIPYGWHFKPFLQRAKAICDEGRLGDVEYFLCHMGSAVASLYRGEEFEYPGMLAPPETATMTDPVLSGGGYLQIQTSHLMGMFFWLTGLEPKSVFAILAAPHASAEIHTAMTMTCTNGAIGTISGSGTLIGPTTNNQLDIRIFGSKGMLVLDCERARMEFRGSDGNDEIMTLAPDAGAYTCDGPAHNFIDLILGKATVNYSPPGPALQAVRFIDAAYRSAKAGALVPV
jgi:predicted dehydrogenase